MLTGDKKETAINIGTSCSLLSSDYKNYIFDTVDIIKLEEYFNDILETKKRINEQFSITITGTTLLNVM